MYVRFTILESSQGKNLGKYLQSQEFYFLSSSAPTEFREITVNEDSFMLTTLETCYTLDDFHTITCFFNSEASLKGNGINAYWSNERLDGSIPIYWDRDKGRASLKQLVRGQEACMYFKEEQKLPPIPKNPKFDSSKLNPEDLKKYFEDNNLADLQNICTKFANNITVNFCIDKVIDITNIHFQREISNKVLYSLVSVLEPKEDRFIIHLKAMSDLNSKVMAVLHCLGHIVLGHVRLGDKYSHWDTKESIINSASLSYWDNEVAETFTSWFEYFLNI